MQSLQLTSFDQITSGLSLDSERSARVVHYRRLYANSPRSAPPEFADAIKAGALWLQINAYRRVSHFWRAAMWSPPPDGVPIGWIDPLKRASIERSIGGYGIVAVDADMSLRVIDSGCWVPVLDPVDSERRIGHVVFWFWHANPQPDNPQQLPDRVDVLQVGEGVNKRQTWTLEGGKLGKLESDRDTDVRGVVVFGDGVSDYTDVESLLTELEYRANRMKRIVDWHADPAMQGPSGFGRVPVANNVPAAVDQRNAAEEYQKSQNQLRQFGHMPFLARGQHDAEYAYLSFDGKTGDARWLAGWLIDQFHIATGIPASALSLTDHAHQSGVSRERQMYSALQRIRELRTEASIAIAEIAALTGQPVADVGWHDTPFGGWLERAQVFAELTRRGVQTPQAAADALGLAIPPETPTPLPTGQ